MKKRIIILAMFVLFCFSSFAKSEHPDFSYVNEIPNTIVMYQCPDNWQFFILKNEGMYWARLYNSSTKKNYQGIFEINKGKKTDIKLRFVNEGMMDDALKFIQPKLEELYSFGDDGNREKMPEDVTVSKNGKSAKLAFFIPFTNVLNVKDKNGKELYSCKKIGIMSADEIQYFSKLELWPEPRFREMQKVSYDKSKNYKASPEYCGMTLPNLWKKNDQFYYLPNTTQNDSVIFKASGEWKNYRTKDFYEVIAIECLINKAIFVIPESVKVYKKGDFICSEYIFGDINYWESNKRILGYSSTNPESFDIFVFTGYTDFIDKNRTMIVQIIDSVKIKK